MGERKAMWRCSLTAVGCSCRVEEERERCCCSEDQVLLRQTTQPTPPLQLTRSCCLSPESLPSSSVCRQRMVSSEILSDKKPFKKSSWLYLLSLKKKTKRDLEWQVHVLTNADDTSPTIQIPCHPNSLKSRFPIIQIQIPYNPDSIISKFPTIQFP